MKRLTDEQVGRLPEWMLEIHQEIILRSCMFTSLSKPSENQMRLLHELAHALAKVEAGKLLAEAVEVLGCCIDPWKRLEAEENVDDALKAWNEVSND